MLHVRYGATTGGIPAGTSVGVKVSNLDLAPSLFALSGVTGEFDTDGVSWANVVRGTATTLERSHLIMEMANDFGIVDTATSAKLVFQDQSKANNLLNTNARSNYPNWGVETQLYDLTTDGAEATNVATSGTWASQLATLNAAKADHVAYVTNKPCCSVTMSLVASGGNGAAPAPAPAGSPFPSPPPSPTIAPGATTTTRYLTRVAMIAAGSVADFTDTKRRQVRQLFATAASVTLPAVSLQVDSLASGSGRRLARVSVAMALPWRRLQSASSVVLTATIESSSASARNAVSSSLATSLSTAATATTFLSAAGVTVTATPSVASADEVVAAPGSGDDDSLGLIIGAAVGGTIAFIAIAIGLWWAIKRRSSGLAKKSTGVSA